MCNKITKREFIKNSSIAACGLGLGFSHIDSLANIFRLNHPCSRLSQNEDKYSIEARYYTMTPKGVKCLLCPNFCKLKENETGECRTRINQNGKLICFAYGNPCAVHIDPIEKKPLYHFYPGSNIFSIATAGCNLACLNCQNWEISQTSPNETKNYDLSPDEVINNAHKQNCKSIAYTYTDPVAFYEYTADTAMLAKEEGLKNVLVSAGYINEEPLKEWCKYIDAANIDLKSFDNEIYEMLNAGTLDPVLNTLKTLKYEGIWLEITNLVIPSWTDNLDMIKKMCDWLADNGFQDTPIHFSRFHPQYKLTNLPVTPVNVLVKAKDIAFNAGLKYVYIGNVPGQNFSNTICPHCHEIVVERKGYKILQNNINNGTCINCQNNVSGIWN